MWLVFEEQSSSRPQKPKVSVCGQKKICDVIMKPVRYAVSFILKNDKEEILVVKRPDDDELGGVWGLPATTLNEGELPEHGIRRGGKEKLGCEIEPTKFIGATTMERSDYTIHMMDFEADITKGAPDVSKATKGTKYDDQKWTSELDILVPACLKGSACVRIFLYKTGFCQKKGLAHKCAINV